MPVEQSYVRRFMLYGYLPHTHTQRPACSMATKLLTTAIPGLIAI